MENSNPNHRYNEEGYYGQMNGNSNHLDPNDMATDEDAVERKKVLILDIELTQFVDFELDLCK